MDNANEFTALLQRIGFTNNNQKEEITNQGINTCDDLADLSEEELKAVRVREGTLITGGRPITRLCSPF